jgi:hypothetical protein
VRAAEPSLCVIHVCNAAAAGAARASAAEAAVAAAESAAKLNLLNHRLQEPQFHKPWAPAESCTRNCAAAAGAVRASAAEAAVAAAESALKLNLPVGLADVEGSVQQIDDTLFKTLRVSCALCRSFCTCV